MYNDLTKLTDPALKDSIGKEIKKLTIGGDCLNIEFSDNSKIEIYDGAQSCCEHRYMNTDDELHHFNGSRLLGASTRDGGTTDDDNDVKETEFLIVDTSKGSFTVANYNEHNGYYGGFHIKVKKVKDEPNGNLSGTSGSR